MLGSFSFVLRCSFRYYPGLSASDRAYVGPHSYLLSSNEERGVGQEHLGADCPGDRLVLAAARLQSRPPAGRDGAGAGHPAAVPARGSVVHGSAGWCWVDSSGRRNAPMVEAAIGIRKRRSDWSGRDALRSPGRPGVAQREDRQRFWAAIARGLSGEEAAVDGGVSTAVGVRWFREAGGMPPSTFAPSAKPPSERYLSFAERKQLAILRAQGFGVRETARRLGRSGSTVSRELRRNAATRSGGLEYRATTAQWHAERSARRPKPAKLATNAVLRSYVQERLGGAVAVPGGAVVPGPAVPWKGRRHGPRQARRWAKAWSPQQIAQRLRLDFPDDKTMRISHEAIYQFL